MKRKGRPCTSRQEVQISAPECRGRKFQQGRHNKCSPSLWCISKHFNTSWQQGKSTLDSLFTAHLQIKTITLSDTSPIQMRKSLSSSPDLCLVLPLRVTETSCYELNESMGVEIFISQDDQKLDSSSWNGSFLGIKWSDLSVIGLPSPLPIDFRQVTLLSQSIRYITFSQVFAMACSAQNNGSTYFPHNNWEKQLLKLSIQITECLHESSNPCVSSPLLSIVLYKLYYIYL